MSEEIEENLSGRLLSIYVEYVPPIAVLGFSYLCGFGFGVTILVSFVVFDRVMAKYHTGNWLGQPKDLENHSKENESDDEDLSLAEKLRKERTYPPTKEVSKDED